MRTTALGILAFGLLLAACGEQTLPPQAAVAAAPAPDPATQKLYERSCKGCHGVTGTGAPGTGDAAAWAPRVQQGRETLLDHTITGYKSMPPMGACPDCAEAQFVALIEHMSGAKLK